MAQVSHIKTVIMKKLKALVIPFATLCCLFAGCSKDKVQDIINGTAMVHISVGDFAITQEDFPQAKSTQDAADYANAKAITLAFYASDGSEVYQTTQLKADPSTYTTFGEFDCELTIGSYTMVAVARNVGNGDEFTLTSPTEAAYTSERPRETFTAVQSVLVTSTAPLDLTTTLNRISSCLKIVSTDGRPAEATKILTTFEKGGKSFNPTTGLALTDAGFAQTNNPSSAAGATIDVSSFPLLYTDEETMTITIQALDANDNVLITKTVTNVPFKRNRMTTLTGAVYTPGSSSATFQLETTWLDGNTVPF